MPRVLPGIVTVTSASTLDPSGAGPFSIVVNLDNTQDPPFSHSSMIDGSVFVQSQNDQEFNWFIGRIVSWNAADPLNPILQVAKIGASSAAASNDSWYVSFIDGPPVGLPYLGLTGLIVTCADGSVEVEIGAGSVRDFTDSVNLVLDNPLTKYLDTAWADGDNAGGITQTDDLTGTITSAVLAVTGTGTTFGADFDRGWQIADREGGYLTDYSQQVAGGNVYSGNPFTAGAIIASGGVVTTVDDATSNTALTTTAALGVTDATFKRGGVTDASYAVCLIRKDSDGSIDACISSFTGSGAPDLPSGYTYYRVLALLVKAGAARTITQPLRSLTTPEATQAQMEAAAATGVYASPANLLYHPAIPKVMVSWTWITAAITGNISSVDTATERITWSTNHLLASGDCLFSTGGTWPTGYTATSAAFVHVVSATVFTLHLTYADAIAGTSPIDLTAAGSGTRTASKITVTISTLSFGVAAADPKIVPDGGNVAPRFAVFTSVTLTSTAAGVWFTAGGGAVAPASTTQSGVLGSGANWSITPITYIAFLYGDLA